MRTRSLVPCLILLSASLSLAQQAKKGIGAEGGPPDEQGSSRVLYWNEKTNSAAGEFAFNYGRPRWKKEYEDAAKFDAMTNGKVWRMGSNFWTNLDTNIPLKIAGKDIDVGSYYLGLHRSADGAHWALAFIDPAAVRKARTDGFEIQKAPIKFEVPMTNAQAAKTVEKLTITLTYPKTNVRKVTMKVAWGNLALTAPIEATVTE